MDGPAHPDRPPAVERASASAPPGPTTAPVFLHCMWRTGSTFIFGKFRENPRYRCFYEPLNEALATLKGKPKVKRTMWSRRAQEYEAKINSGDLIQIAEVVRDLFRSESQPEQSYSERQLYEAALDRMVRELSAVEDVTETEAAKMIEAQLMKAPTRNKKAEGATDEQEAAA